MQYSKTVLPNQRMVRRYTTCAAPSARAHGLFGENGSSGWPFVHLMADLVSFPC